MATLGDTNSFDLAIGPIINLFTTEQARQIVEFRADSKLELRVEELAEKSNAGELTPAERSELEGYARASRFLAVLQVQAARKLRDCP